MIVPERVEALIIKINPFLPPLKTFQMMSHSELQPLETATTPFSKMSLKLSTPYGPIALGRSTMPTTLPSSLPCSEADPEEKVLILVNNLPGNSVMGKINNKSDHSKKKNSPKASTLYCQAPTICSLAQNISHGRLYLTPTIMLSTNSQLLQKQLPCRIYTPPNQNCLPVHRGIDHT